MIKIEIVLTNGLIKLAEYEKTQEDFLDLVKFDQGNNYVKDTDGYYTLIKNIVSFKFV